MDWTRQERVTRTVEFTIPAPEPWGACYNQVLQALSKAREELALAKRDLLQRGVISDVTIGDDEIRMHCRDDVIVISFTAYDGPVSG